jgi:hypothetical protein
MGMETKSIACSIGFSFMVRNKGFVNVAENTYETIYHVTRVSGFGHRAFLDISNMQAASHAIADQLDTRFSI